MISELNRVPPVQEGKGRGRLSTMEASHLVPGAGENQEMNSLVLLGGRTFFVSAATGDIDATDTFAAGLMHKDTRHLSRHDIMVNGYPTRPLTHEIWRPGSARMFNLAEDGDDLAPELTVVVDRMVVTDGVHEDVSVRNSSSSPIDCKVEFRFDADFADLFEVRGMDGPARTVVKSVHGDGIDFSYTNDGFSRRTYVSVSAEGGRPNGSGPTFGLTLEPRSEWKTCVHITCEFADEGTPTWHCPFAPDYDNETPVRFVRLIEKAPSLSTDHEGLRHAYRQAIRDLAALHFPAIEGKDWLMPAAGLPWFMAVFGRDSLISAYQSLPFMPDLARSTLLALGARQAVSVDDFRDAQPGKILHELRLGELSVTGKIPFGPSYASHDATLLYLVLLDEYHRWTGDDQLVKDLEPVARRALDWMTRYGDCDGDGLLEYYRHSSGGLVNQGWKDSFDSIRFADGRLAEGPIATVEIQGYAYDARRRTARLAEEVWGDPDLASHLRAEAETLRIKVEESFWMPGGYYALALDGEKKEVDAVTSNMGHLLWSQLISPDRADIVVRRLLGSDMNSGWGIRTMSTSAGGYNPLSYHNGSVWPHDTSLIADGMRRYGYQKEASALALSLIDAAAHFGFQLPELFAGHNRDEMGFPVRYPSANRPQAWASGAVLLGLRTIMGLDVEDGQVTSVGDSGDGSIPIEIKGIYGPGESRSTIAVGNIN